MFVCLCLSVLTLSSGFLLNVKAESNSGISILSLSDEDQLGYGALVNTGQNEWDWFFDFVEGLNLENYQYIIRPDSSGYIDILYSPSPTWNGTTVTFSTFYECREGTCSLNTTNAKTFNFPSNLILAMKLTQPSSGTVATYTNWNSVNATQAYGYYLNSNSEQATTQDVIDTINGQWEMNDDENLGVDSIVPEVENKLGVLGFASDTLIQFVDLFNPSNANGTTLTFPAFTINVDGQSYQVWNDITYDLNTLYQHFSFLIDTVRTILTLFVWIAVFNYLVKEYERFVNG